MHQILTVKFLSTPPCYKLTATVCSIFHPIHYTKSKEKDLRSTTCITYNLHQNLVNVKYEVIIVQSNIN